MGLQASISGTQYAVVVSDDSGYAQELRLVDAEKFSGELVAACEQLRTDVEAELESSAAPGKAEQTVEPVSESGTEPPSLEDAAAAVLGDLEDDEVPDPTEPRVSESVESIAARQLHAAAQETPAEPILRQEGEDPVGSDPFPDLLHDVDESMTRAELNAHAEHVGVPDPSALKTKADVVAAIDAVVGAPA